MYGIGTDPVPFGTYMQAFSLFARSTITAIQPLNVTYTHELAILPMRHEAPKCQGSESQYSQSHSASVRTRLHPDSSGEPLPSPLELRRVLLNAAGGLGARAESAIRPWIPRTWAVSRRLALVLDPFGYRLGHRSQRRGWLRAPRANRFRTLAGREGRERANTPSPR
jgi:hypothetical protein